MAENDQQQPIPEAVIPTLHPGMWLLERFGLNYRQGNIPTWAPLILTTEVPTVVLNQAQADLMSLTREELSVCVVEACQSAGMVVPAKQQLDQIASTARFVVLGWEGQGKKRKYGVTHTSGKGKPKQLKPIDLLEGANKLSDTFFESYVRVEGDLSKLPNSVKSRLSLLGINTKEAAQQFFDDLVVQRKYEYPYLPVSSRERDGVDPEGLFRDFVRETTLNMANGLICGFPKIPEGWGSSYISTGHTRQQEPSIHEKGNFHGLPRDNYLRLVNYVLTRLNTRGAKWFSVAHIRGLIMASDGMYYDEKSKSWVYYPQYDKEIMQSDGDSFQWNQGELAQWIQHTLEMANCVSKKPTKDNAGYYYEGRGGAFARFWNPMRLSNQLEELPCWQNGGCPLIDVCSRHNYIVRQQLKKRKKEETSRGKILTYMQDLAKSVNGRDVSPTIFFIDPLNQMFRPLRWGDRSQLGRYYQV